MAEEGKQLGHFHPPLALALSILRNLLYTSLPVPVHIACAHSTSELYPQSLSTDPVA